MTVYFCSFPPVPSCDDRSWLEDLKDTLCTFEQDIQTQLASLSSGNVLGEIKYIARVADDTNLWLRCDGRTIADAGATPPAVGLARSNSDMEDLFTLLWDADTSSNLGYYLQGGGGSSRGASAAADWGAGKQITLPDTRGRVLAGMDNPTGASAANRITGAWADQLFGAGGLETHTLTEAQMPSHTGHITGQNVQSGVSAVYASSSVGGASKGSGNAHANIQPTFTPGNYFVYTGN